MSARSRRAYLGIDTGGTFTDFVCVRGRRLLVLKIPSTPRDPALAVLDGLETLEARGPEAIVCYGSTVATNALLERRGASVVLVTTEGFEDVLEIGRQARPQLYTLTPVKPEPLVPHARRLGIRERTLYDGSVERPLTDRTLRATVQRVRRLRPDAVAVCLLHSYANPDHERRIGAALTALGIPISLSQDLVREYREYERLSTTVINAYVAPTMSRHLGALEHGMRGKLRVMQSSGGVVGTETARQEPVRTILSGPAGGVIGALELARRAGYQRILTLDMGGTSTDVCLVDGSPLRRTDARIGGLPVKVPTIDIHTVGAGGGSIARLDAGGSLKVGPESAGAAPGPACYGRGTAATVTDANLLLGRLISAEFLGGRMSISTERARRAIAPVARKARLGLDETAEGIIRVVNASMERALRVISVERGVDPRGFVLVAFGGAAGLHACELAESLGLRTVMIPREPGLLSAWGMLTADVVKDYTASVLKTDLGTQALESLYRPLIERARRDMTREQARPTRARLIRTVDARYPGQSYEIEIPFGPGYRASFHAAHERLYGSSDASRPVEVVNLRLKCVAPIAGRLPTRLGPPTPAGSEPSAREQARARTSVRRPVRWRGRWLSTRILQRSSITSERELRGPAILCEFSSTTFVPPGWEAATDRSANLLLRPTTQPGAKAAGARRKHRRRK